MKPHELKRITLQTQKENKRISLKYKDRLIEHINADMRKNAERGWSFVNLDYSIGSYFKGEILHFLKETGFLIRIIKRYYRNKGFKITDNDIRW